MQISASERSSVRSSGSLYCRDVRRLQLVPQNDRIVAVLFHISFGCPAPHRQGRSTCRSGRTSGANTLAGVSGARHNGSCHARGRIRRTVHGRAAFRLRRRRSSSACRMSSSLRACVRAPSIARRPRHNSPQARRAFFVRQIILKLAIGQQDDRVPAGRSASSRRSFSAETEASHRCTAGSLRLPTSCNKVQKTIIS